MPATLTDSSSAKKGGSRYEKLRRGVRGANGLTRAEVVANQRTRLYEATVEVTAAVGYEAMTIKAVCALAGVSRRTFYDLFGAAGPSPGAAGPSPKEACFLAAYDFAVGRAAGRINRAYRAEHDPECAPVPRLRAVRAECSSTSRRPRGSRSSRRSAPVPRRWRECSTRGGLRADDRRQPGRGSRRGCAAPAGRQGDRVRHRADRAPAAAGRRGWARRRWWSDADDRDREVAIAS